MRRTELLAVVLLVVLVAAACSTTADPERFCEVRAEIDQLGDFWEMSPDDARQAVGEVRNLIDEAVRVAPDEIRASVDIGADSITQFLDLFEAADFDSAQLDTEGLEAAFERAFSEEGVRAEDALDEWTDANCSTIDTGPVEVFLVLNDYKVDETTGECSGSGALSGVGEGSRVFLIDSSGGIIDPSATPVESRVLPSGTEITRDADSVFLFPTDQDAGCVFIWADPGLEFSVYVGDVVLFTELGFDVPGGMHVSGQRVVFTLVDINAHEVPPPGGTPEDG